MGSDVNNMKETLNTVTPFMKTTGETLQSLKQQFDAIKDQVYFHIIIFYCDPPLSAIRRQQLL